MLLLPPDTVPLAADSLVTPDTVDLATGGFLDGPVHYQARDSIRMDMRSKKAFLYGNTGDAIIEYMDMNIKAAYITVDFSSKRLDASSLPDSTGKDSGHPVFKQGDQDFRAKQMSYNFGTRKGLIRDVITNEGEGYLHGENVKRLATEDYYISKGKYTTCSLDDPHFEIRFTKAKMTKDKKIVTGPAYLVVQDIPTPLALPFGYFPAKTIRSSGLILPSYGESANRGFYLEGGGYYWGVSDHMDLAFTGDIYSRGSWAVKTLTHYNFRYRFSGSISATYAINLLGDRGTPDFEQNEDFRIEWVHNQSPKARPNSRFNANVKAGTQSFNKFNPTNSEDYLSNTFNSGISYSTRIAGRLKLSANMGLSQNTGTGIMTLTAPQVNLSSGRFYPLKPKKRKGKAGWYEKVSMSYTMDTKNTLTTHDSLFVLPDILDEMKYGVKHYIPVSADFKLFKLINLTFDAKYTERWYWQTIDKQWRNDIPVVIEGDTSYTSGVVTQVIDGFRAARDYTAGATVNSRIYGYLDIAKGPVATIRHVMTPTVGFSYHPDYYHQRWGYYRYYLDEDADAVSYSIFKDGIYGGPTGGKSGSVNLSLANNFEAKIRSRKDSAEVLKKVKLIDNLSIATSYNLAADSIRWAPLSINMRTLLFKKINIVYSARYDLYAKDPESGMLINKYVWEVSDRLLNLDNFAWQFSVGYNLKSKKTGQKDENESLSPDEQAYLRSSLDNFIDFDNPWDLSFDYSFRYGERMKADGSGITKDVTHTLNLNGNISLTPKWKFGIRTGYDFIRNDFTYTSIDVYRDLHCWEMTFNWIPTGFQKSYNFTVRVKAPMLQDLKLTKKTDFRDLYY